MDMLCPETRCFPRFVFTKRFLSQEPFDQLHFENLCDVVIYQGEFSETLLSFSTGYFQNGSQPTTLICKVFSLGGLHT